MSKRRWHPPGKQLKDYRFVYANPDGEIGSPIQREIRKLLQKNPGSFMDRLEKLERQHVADREVAKEGWKEEARLKAAAAGEVERELDAGHERVMELTTRLLEEISQEVAK